MGGSVDTRLQVRPLRADPPGTMRTQSPGPQVLFRTGAALVMIAVLTGACSVLYRHLHDHPWSQLGADLAALGPGPVALALLATLASYGALTGYDALALRYVEHPLPYRRYAAASFVATAFGNSLGASAVVGAALRARVYSAWGVPGFAITRIIGFNLVTLSLGSMLLAAAGIAAAPHRVAASLHLPTAGALALAATLLAAVVGYLAWSGTGKPASGLRGWRIDRPSRPLALAQLALSTLEWLTMAAVLYVLLPGEVDIGFGTFAAMFVVATAAGLLSSVPGGLGVFESVLVLALGGAVTPTQLVTALVAYRLVYFVAPLAAAAVLLAVLESQRDRARFAGLLRRAGVLTPSVSALGVGAVGLVLVVTGDVPGDSPAPDMTTFTASLAGLLLLLLARGLHRRLHGAWALTLALLAAVLPVSAMHGASGLAAVCGLLVVLLAAARRAFHRTTSVLADPRGWAWTVTVAGIFSVFVWWHDLWLGQGIVDGRTVIATSAGGGTPASVRLGLALGLVGVVVGGTRLQVPGRSADTTASDGELQRAGRILATASHGNASLLWTGDKRLLFSGRGNALLMYQVEGRSWVVMADPVGAQDEFDDLLERFLDLCDGHCGRPVFYSVREDLADLYRRHGLALAKLGEEATVPLAGFGLTGKGRGKLRSECRASARNGCVVEVVTGDDVEPLLPQLRAVSDAWLAARNAKEKRFSLGAFDEEYVRRFPVAVARLDGQVVAFASLWASRGRHEVKVDLMRRVAGAPRTVMSHLFVESMSWARDEGYASFSLGMAPLSGLRTDGTASFWDRVGTFLWTHGEHFYNFQGLRQFKERFDPQWQPRYVASRGGPALPVMMLNVATLVGGGLRGLVSR
jgi:phosphatidylglycerol lysyltransferase